MTVYLGGGGSAQQEAALWRPMLARRPRVLYWPFALGGEMLASAEIWLRGSLERFQSGLDVVTWTTLDGHHQTELVGVDLLFIGGGNTYDLLAHLRAHGALEWVRAHLGGGGDLYGGSAGAVLAGASTAIAAWADENTTDLTTPDELAGLDLLAGRVLLPHVTEADVPRARQWSAQHGLEVLGVPEASGLVVEGDDVVVAGPEPVWRCTSQGAEALPAGSALPVTPPGGGARGPGRPPAPGRAAPAW